MSDLDEPMQAWLEGQPAPAWVPVDRPSAAWHWPLFLVLGDPTPGAAVVDRYRSRTKRVGVLQHGPLAVLCLQHGLGMDVMPRPLLVGEDPDLDSWGGNHLLWKVVFVQRGVIANMAAFTSGPALTGQVRRIMNEQQAAGPITRDEYETALEAFWAYREPLSERELWSRCIVTSTAGD